MITRLALREIAETHFKVRKAASVYPIVAITPEGIEVAPESALEVAPRDKWTYQLDFDDGAEMYWYTTKVDGAEFYFRIPCPLEEYVPEGYRPSLMEEYTALMHRFMDLRARTPMIAIHPDEIQVEDKKAGQIAKYYAWTKDSAIETSDGTWVEMYHAIVHGCKFAFCLHKGETLSLLSDEQLDDYAIDRLIDLEYEFMRLYNDRKIVGIQPGEIQINPHMVKQIAPLQSWNLVCEDTNAYPMLMSVRVEDLRFICLTDKRSVQMLEEE